MTLRRDGMANPKEQALPYPTATAAIKAAVCASLLLLPACGGTNEEKSDTPSGYPVPRWISVRGAPASMRAGPGLDYPILWQFERSGAPLQVVTETEEWRKVCGPDGSMGLDSPEPDDRTAARDRPGSDRPAGADAEAGSDVRARIETGAMISLETCENGWCRLRSGDFRGWTREAVLFGTAHHAAVRPPRAGDPR
jgi:SH3-like domain-containing protein